jgi:glycosyltransferase involved in cell wall biosynthesis
MANKVSVAIATYNGSLYLTEQLNSILKQSLPPFEIVITDDASTDHTIEIIKKFQISYPNIILFQNEVNKGVTKTFENSVQQCAGDFIAISDQDDIWVENKLELLISNLNNGDAIYGNSLLVDANGTSLGVDFKSLLKMQSLYTGMPFFLSNCVPGHGILMKNNFAKKILPFPSNIMFDQWIGFAAASANGLKYVDEVLVHYRQHQFNTIGTSKSTNKKNKKNTTQIFEGKLLELQAMQKAPIKDAETKEKLITLISLFHRNWSFKRCIFFFKNKEKILLFKNKSSFRKFLFCIKMFFKPNY